MNSNNLSDVQSKESSIRIGLRRVGVSNIPKIIRRRRGEQYNELSAKIDVFVDLLPTKRGIHMSRNIEAINKVTAELLEDIIIDTEELCARIAKKVISVQPGASFAEVRLVADYEMVTFSEAIMRDKTSVHKLHAGAYAEKTKNRIKITKIIGAEVEGTTVCPCSQELSKDFARERLKKLGFSDSQITEILEVVPIAAHNQRSKAILILELPEGAPRIELEEIIKLLEDSMSAPIHEVLKRKDEQSVVLYAHKRPAFVEDVVRIILLNVVHRFPQLPDETVVCVKQINLESIHQHNAVAEMKITLGEIKAQLNEAN